MDQNKMITLDENHIYHDGDGNIIPGVTSVLKDVGVIDDRWFDDYSRTRGQMVHLATALYDRDDLEESSVNPVIEPYLNAWIKFRKESGYVPDMIEKIVHNKIYGYAGTLDRTGTKNGVKELTEIKSGTVQSWAELQTAAYAGCLDGVYKRYAIELHDNGSYKKVVYDNRQDWGVWLSCLTLRNYKYNKGILK